MRPAALVLLLGALPALRGASAPDIRRLPDWAREAIEASRAVTVPADAEAWVLLDRTEVAYTGDGEVRVHRYRVVQVLGEQGTGESVYRLAGTGAATSKVKKLKGWNLRPDGDLEKLDRDDVESVEGRIGEEGSYSTDSITTGVLPRAVKGSYLAFESLEVRQQPIGPVEELYPMEDVPVLTWQCAAAKKEGWFTDLKEVALRLDLAHFEAWGLHPVTGEGSVEIHGLPALPKAEPYIPNEWDLYPRVQVRFLDPASAPRFPDWSRWKGLAQFTARAFSVESPVVGAVPAPLPVPGAASDPRARLAAALDWMDRNLDYRQIYLSPSRGWIPEAAEETRRKRYGDCKDFTACFLDLARQAGFQGAPVLSRINGGRMTPGMPPGQGFNHVIAAIRLQASLGLPGEVETPSGRFLLVDPTDHATPLGWLGSQHQGEWLLICLPEREVWVQAPAAAIRQGGISIALQGRMEPSRVLSGTLRLSEVENAGDLRLTAAEGDGKALMAGIRGLLGLPTVATCELLRKSDPRDLDHPFLIELRISMPDAMDSDGQEYDLTLPGFPGIPARPTVNGRPRSYPLERLGGLQVTYEAEIDLPLPVAPVRPEITESTAIRDIAWSAKAEHARVSLNLRMTMKGAQFGPQALDAGVKAFLADREAMLKLRQDGLAFKVQL